MEKLEKNKKTLLVVCGCILILIFAFLIYNYFFSTKEETVFLDIADNLNLKIYAKANENAQFKVISVSNDSMLSISEDGVVTVLSEGESTIEYKINDKKYIVTINSDSQTSNASLITSALTSCKFSAASTSINTTQKRVYFKISESGKYTVSKCCSAFGLSSSGSNCYQSLKSTSTYSYYYALNSSYCVSGYSYNTSKAICYKNNTTTSGSSCKFDASTTYIKDDVAYIKVTSSSNASTCCSSYGFGYSNSYCTQSIKTDADNNYTYYSSLSANYCVDGYSYDATKKICYNQKFKVVTYNVGNFSYGASQYPAGTKDIYDAIDEVITETNADVYMFTEWDQNFISGQTLSKDKFNYSGYSYSAFDGYNRLNSMVSQMNLFKGTSSNEVIKYFCESDNCNSASDKDVFNITYDNETYTSKGRGFIDNTITIGGKEVHFITTHLSWALQTLRQNEMNKIISYIEENNIKYFVIAGDFNLGLGEDVNVSSTKTRNDFALEDVKIFLDKGYISVQGNEILNEHSSTKTISTATLDGNTYYFTRTYFSGGTLDNIVLSNNMKIEAAYVTGLARAKEINRENPSCNIACNPKGVDSSLIGYAGSDHFALVADISFTN